MARQVAAFGTAGLSRAADLFAVGLTEMRGTTAPRLLLELLCARVLLPTASSDAVLARVERLERRFDIGTGSAAAAAAPAAPQAPAGVPARAGGAAGPSVSTGPAVRATRTSPAAPPAPAGPTAPLAPAAPAAGAALPVPDDAAWPTPAVLGAGAPVAAPAGAEAPGAGAAGPAGLDATEVRRGWDAVLEKVKESKRVTHARLSETTVASLERGRLSVSFTTPTLARQFSEGVHVEVLQEALREVLGADLVVVCVWGPSHLPPPGGPGASPGPAPRPAPSGTAAASASRAPSPAAGRPAAEHEGFRAGDEAADEDSDVPVERGEDAALRLVEQTLGGRVLGTIDE